MAQRLLRPLAALFLACLAPGWTHAAELGEPHVSSFIGQQLVADIELAPVDDPAGTVGVKLANPDVYRGASIAMPPVLDSLNMTVMRRDGRQFLHLTSLRPVDADHLHVFLELADGGKRSVRLATLWLAADPNPAPVAAPVAAGAAASIAAVPPKAGVQAAPPAGKRTRAPSSLAEKSSQAVPHEPVPIEPARPAKPQRPAALRAPAVPVKPRKQDVSPAPAAPSASKPSPRAKQPPAALAAHRTAEAPATLPIHAPAPAAACAQQPAPESPSVCLALDGKNAALRAEIGHLENQVKALQAALKVPRTAAPKPQSATPRKRAQKKPPEEHVPAWVWIASGAAALAAGAAAFAVRRRRAGKGKGKKPRKSNKPEMDIVVTPRVMGDVRSRLMTEGPPSRMPAEPKL